MHHNKNTRLQNVFLSNSKPVLSMFSFHSVYIFLYVAKLMWDGTKMFVTFIIRNTHILLSRIDNGHCLFKRKHFSDTMTSTWETSYQLTHCPLALRNTAHISPWSVRQLQTFRAFDAISEVLLLACCYILES